MKHSLSNIDKFLAVATLLTVSFLPSSLAEDYSVLISTHLPMPDGNGTIEGLTVPILNNQEQVAFRISAGNTSTNSSFWAIAAREEGYGFVFQMAREDEHLTGGTNRYNILGGANIGDLALNNNGHTVFWAELYDTPGGNADNEGFFASTIGSGTVTKVARKGDSFSGLTWSDLVFGTHPALNDLQQIVLPITLAGGGVVSSNNQGIFRFGTNSTVNQIVREGDAVAAGNGYFSTFSDYSLNNAGQVSFISTLVGNTNGIYDNLGVFIYNDGEVVEVARTKYGVVDDLGSPSSINEDGFTAYLVRDGAGGGVTNFILMSSPFIQTELARTGDGITKLTNVISSISEGIDLNDHGEVLFRATLSPSGEALLRAKPGYLENETIAYSGQSLPGRTNKLTTFGIGSFGYSQNNRSQVAFIGQIDNSGRALMFYDKASGLIEIAKTGDSLLGSTIANLAIGATTASGSVPDERCGLNDFGDVAFWFGLADGNQGIAVWEPPQIGITSIVRRTNDVIINFGTLGDRPTLLERASNLNGIFTTVLSNYYVNGGNPIATNYVDTGAITNNPQGFYRLKIVP
jgi:hypothetical protein